MRAVNLIPHELRRGGIGAPGRSGGAVYAVLGGLSALVLMVAVYVLAGNSVTSKRSELTRVKADADQQTAVAAQLKPYADFASLSEARTQTVAQLAASRFDWDGTIRQIARVLPAQAQITSLKGTVNPQVQVEAAGGASGDTAGVRATSSDPAIEISGCALNQTEVARVLSRLRLVDGTRRVTLVSSDKPDESAASAAPGSNSTTGCAPTRTIYSLVMFFAPLGGPATTPGSGAKRQPVPQPPTSADLTAGSTPPTQPVSTGENP